MALDSTGMRIVKRGRRVLMGPFLWEVVKVTTSGQVWLRDPLNPTGSLITRPSNACTVYDAHMESLEPAGPAEVPLMPEADE
jgi:hypothetical protein